MLVCFFSWWLTTLRGLLPKRWIGEASCLHRAIIIDTDGGGTMTASVVQRNGCRAAVGLDVAARLARRRAVLLRPPAGAVLVKHHHVPTSSRRTLDRLLRYELARISPFQADALFWRWDGRPRAGNPAQTAVAVTMIPREAVAVALAVLEDLGVRVDALVAGSAEKPNLVRIADDRGLGKGALVVRGLAFACVCLGLVGLVLPAARQEIALHQTEAAITALQPSVTEVEAIRRSLHEADARRDIVAQAVIRTGDASRVLATVTRLLPDDAFLTEFAWNEGRMTISGRSASAPRLVTALSADPAIHDVAFAAPVLRVEGTSFDLFSIQAGLAQR